ncbi:MFS transporter [Chloroflexota bacterium]
MKRHLVFYGWYIVVAALLLSIFHAGVIAYGFSAFIAPISASFGWSYAQISLATSFRSMEVGAFEPLAGIAADRWPPRRLMLIGVTLYGLGILCIVKASSLITFYAGFIIIGLASTLVVYIVPQTTIARWFKKDIGKASGMLSIGAGIGGALVPIIVLMIDSYGWQTSLFLCALVIFVVGMPLSFIFRTRPEDYGLIPDGKYEHDVEASQVLQSNEYGIGARKLLRTRVFWHIGITFMLLMGVMTAVITHVMPYLDSLGVKRSTASMIAMLIPLASIPARLGYGLLADVFPKKYVVAVASLLTIVGLILLWLIDGSSLGLMITFGIVFGLGLGGPQPLRLVIIREYFGTKKFGTIFGLLGIFTMTGAVIGPPVVGWVFDTVGSYKSAWLVSIGITMVASIVIISTQKSQRNAIE